MTYVEAIKDALSKCNLCIVSNNNDRTIEMNNFAQVDKALELFQNFIKDIDKQLEHFITFMTNELDDLTGGYAGEITINRVENLRNDILGREVPND